ncbi:MAG: histidine phosphatase family protein [Neptuniibacter caesariensis]|uniref:Histidine phosphatase family protein n=1 Tax=Neptuniibacter caesariensis TaxID=207954 RepID=A0A2G6JKT6_NEPCE|nr:MAG: histidine phosphatase family protein [Neptuniibacter caesariensis]
MKSKRIDLLRHGEPELRGVYLGRTDCKLSINGRLDAVAAVSWQCHWDLIVTSPLMRCYETACWYAEQTGVELLVVPEVQELDFGDWDGRTFESVYASDAQQADLFWQDPAHNPPPNGETVTAFRHRVNAAVKLLLEHPCQHPLVITHGGVIRCLVGEVLGIEAGNWARIKVDYSSFTELSFGYSAQQYWPQLVSCNTKQPSIYL